MLKKMDFLTFLVLLDFWEILWYNPPNFFNLYEFFMKLERPNFFLDEDYQEELVYGPEGRFKSLNLDFWTDVYPNILQTYIKTKQPEKGYPDAFTHPDYYPIGVDQTLRLCIRTFQDIFSACFEIDTDDYKRGKITTQDIEDLADAKGMVGALARIRTKVGNNGRYFLRELLYLFKKFGNSPVQLTKHLPTVLYPDFLKEIRTPFYMLAEQTKSPEIKKEIDKIVFLQHPQATKTIKKPHQYKIVPSEYCRSIIIIENVEFGRKEQEFFWNLICFHGAFNPMEGVFFKDCLFSANYVCPHDAIRARVTFNHCFFEKDFAPAREIKHAITFEQCTVNGKFDFRNSLFHTSFYIHNCIFNRSSAFLLNNSELKFNATPRSRHFIIRNTLFGGDVSFSQTSFEGCNLVLENISFLKRFDFEECTLSDKSTIANIAYTNENTPQREREKEVFKEMLLSHNYQSVISSLGLEGKGKPSGSPHLRYALHAGWMSPKVAASYLEKSISWLAKKRMADKKKRTKTSIPFVGQRKRIMYPRSALYAYRVQDWNKLENCRKEYGFGEKDRKDFPQDNNTKELTIKDLRIS